MGKVQSFLVLNLVAHIIVTTEPERVKATEVRYVDSHNMHVSDT